MKKIFFYSILIISLGFIFQIIDGREMDTSVPRIGQLMWLITPLLLALIFHFGLKQKSDWGLKTRFKKSWHWYLISFLLFPVLLWLLTLIGFSVNSIEKLQSNLTITFVISVITAIPNLFIKNIFEEFVWRGFLFSQLKKQNIFGLKNHLIIGFIWAFWHLPYLEGFAHLYHNMSCLIYIPLFLVGTILTSIIYGEIRTRSGTVWTAVILHTMANALTNTLFIEDYIELVPGREWWVAPAIDNLGYIIFTGVLGWFFLTKKTRQRNSRSTDVKTSSQL